MPTNAELMVEFDGYPWCDTCQKAAVWSEGLGYRHYTPEYPLGLPLDRDPERHEVTCRDWWNTPPFPTD